MLLGKEAESEAIVGGKPGIRVFHPRVSDRTRRAFLSAILGSLSAA
jgi:hypothetical protein